MKLPNGVIAKLCPKLRADIAMAWGSALSAACEEFSIKSQTAQAMWLAQLVHESGGFLRLDENLNYSARRMAQVWPGRFAQNPKAIDLGPNELAQRLADAGPEAIANNVYANRMGNGPDYTGDGWNFRGRYPLQLTGRDAYTQCQAAIGLPDLLHPDMLLDDIPGMARVCGWFWVWKDLGPLAEQGVLAPIVKRWNGGVVGLWERSKAYRDAMLALGAA